jgi:hypothetical protein
MKCDSQASFLARTIASLCFGHERKTRVMIMTLRLAALKLIKKIMMMKNQTPHRCAFE